MHWEKQESTQELRRRLASEDDDVQVAAADEAADLLRTGALDQVEAETLIGDLVQVAVHAQVADVVEEVLYALETGLDHYRPPLSLVRELAVRVLVEGRFPDAVLNIVASTHDRGICQGR